MDFTGKYYENEVRDGYFVPGIMKRCWGAQIEVLKDIIKVCDKYNLEYFAEWGTLLGAVRHGGCIPWDDDMDICMKRKDYNKFLEVFPKEFGKDYAIINFNTVEHKDDFLSRIVNTTVYRFDDEFVNRYAGFPFNAGIDIFPLDFLAPTKKEQDYNCLLMEFAIKIGQLEDNPNISPKEYESYLKDAEEMFHIRIDRNKPAMAQLYNVAEKIFAKYDENNSEEITLMPIWIGNHSFKFKKEFYAKSIEIPFENTTIRVPVGYEPLLKRKYGNYMTPIRTWDSHEYPYYRRQEEHLTEYGIQFSQYKLKETELQPIVKNTKTGVRKEVLDMLGFISQMNVKLCEYMEEGQFEEVLSMLNDEQDGAISIGTLIEKNIGKGTQTVCCLEEYCELIFNFYQTIINEEVDNILPAFEELCAGLGKTKETAELELEEKKTAVFIVQRASSFKYFEPEYRSLIENPEWNVYVMPVPFFEKKLTGELTEKHFEKDDLPEGINIVDYESYSLEINHPDRIYVHDAFDEYDFNFSVLPYFYSKNIAKFTDKLVYIQDFTLDDFVAEDDRAVGMMADYALKPGLFAADEVYVCSEVIRERYVEALAAFAGEETKEIWEGKIKVLPYRVPLCKSKEEIEGEIPADWLKFFKDEGGEFKKTILYGTSFGVLYGYGRKALDKIRESLEEFQKSNLALIWRADPLIEQNESLLDKEVFEEYKKLKEEYENEKFGILDDGSHDDITVVLADAYYGDGQNMAMRMHSLKKLVLIATY